jgi:hypothetical protein
MIDFVIAILEVEVNASKYVHLIDEESGEMRRFPQALKTTGVGKEETKVNILKHGKRLVISGNPLTYFTGQNVVGTMKLQALVYKYIRAVCRDLEIVLSKPEIARIKSGHYRLGRLDIAGYMLLPMGVSKGMVVRELRHFYADLDISMRSHRFSGFAVSDWAKEVAIYDKSPQVSELPSSMGDCKSLIKLVARALRVEVRLRRRELKASNLAWMFNWNSVDPRDVFFNCLKKSEFPKSTVPLASLEKGVVSRTMHLEEIAWMLGYDILDGLDRWGKKRRVDAHKPFRDITREYTGDQPELVNLAGLFVEENFRFGRPRSLKEWEPLAKIEAIDLKKKVKST